MSKKSFALGFLACYALAGIAQARSALEIEATTVAGAIYVGAIWAPFNLLPKEMAISLIPEWAYDFSNPEEMKVEELEYVEEIA